MVTSTKILAGEMGKDEEWVEDEQIKNKTYIKLNNNNNYYNNTRIISNWMGGLQNATH